MTYGRPLYHLSFGGMLKTSSLINMKQEPRISHDPCSTSLTNSMDLHHAMEVEELKAKLAESNNRLLQFQKESTAAQEAVLAENSKLQDDVNKLRDRYERLMDSHKKLQKNNHILECNLLDSVERLSTEKASLQEQIHTLTADLLDAKLFITDLHDTSERYRNDCNLAVQLLQCRPSAFLPQNLNMLPSDIQYRVRDHISSSGIHSDVSNDNSSSRPRRVFIPTFPPTAIVYSTSEVSENNGNNDDEEIPVSVIAQVLAKRSHYVERRGRVVVCSKCLRESSLFNASTQTDDPRKATKEFTPHVHRTRVFAVEHI